MPGRERRFVGCHEHARSGNVIEVMDYCHLSQVVPSHRIGSVQPRCPAPAVGEDDSRIGTFPSVFAQLRSLALNTLRKV